MTRIGVALSGVGQVTAPARHALGRRIGSRFRASDLAFIALLLLGAMLVYVETQGTYFFQDEWDFVVGRSGFSPHVFLHPHGQHLVALPIAVYKVLLGVFGGGSYRPFRVVAALDLVLLAAALGVYSRKRWGEWGGLIPVLLLVTLGPGSPTLLFPFQVGYAVAVAAGLVALLALQRHGSRTDALAFVALLVSLLSESQGVFFLIGAALMIVMSGREVRRRLWIVAVPAILYLLWYLNYQTSSELQFSLWKDVLPYLLQALSATLSALIGLGALDVHSSTQIDPSYGQPVAILLLIALVIALRRGWRPLPLFWAAALTLLGIWTASCLANVPTGSRAAESGRYVAVNAVLLFVCICSALPRPRLGRAGAIATCVVLGLVAATNAAQYASFRAGFATAADSTRAQLGAMAVMRGIAQNSFRPAPPPEGGLLKLVYSAGLLYDAFDSYGIAFDSTAQMQVAAKPDRRMIDKLLVSGERIGFKPDTTPPPLASTPPSILSGTASLKRGCLVLGPAHVVLRAPVGVDVTAPSAAPVHAAIGRFSVSSNVPIYGVPHGTSAHLRPPSDRATQVPWRIELEGAGGRVCSLP